MTLDLVVLDILTELSAGSGYTNHVPLLVDKPSNYQNVQRLPKIHEGVALTDPDGAFTAALTDAQTCLQAWLSANKTMSLSTAMSAAGAFQHEHCSLRVVTPPAALASAPTAPSESIDMCTLQHMIGQLHPQLELADQEDGRPLFNTLHTVDSRHDTCATVQPLGAPIVLPNRCRFLMSDIRRLDALVAGACSEV